MNAQARKKRILLAGSTGTIGRATAKALVGEGHDVVCLARRGADISTLPQGVDLRFADVRDASSVATDAFRGEAFDAVISCLASRTGVPEDARTIDRDANLVLLNQAKALGVGHFILLSAICVQKPELSFQFSKLEFEDALRKSEMAWTIVRPTAFFKSLSGQIGRIKSGKPFLVFGTGRETSCKPISDRDLANFLVNCLEDPNARNAILPIGGPGPAITPLDQAECLFSLLERPVHIRRVPFFFMDAIVAGLSAAALVASPIRAKVELARIGRYYARESMLVFDTNRARYDADATPSFGSDTLFDHYAALIRGDAAADLGAHAVFGDS